VLGFAVIISILAGVIVGIAPAFSMARVDVQEALKDSGRGTSAGPGRLRLRAALVSAEIALAVVLTLGAGLLVRSFVAVLDVDPGFRPDGLLTLQLTLPARLTAPDARLAFYREMFARLEAVPGVTAVGGTTRLPLGSGNVTTRLAIEGRSSDPADLVEVEFRRALHNYFSAMGIPVVRGRGFTDADGVRGAEPVVMVNEAMARKFWPGADPVGQRVRLSPDPRSPWSRIIGVLGSVRHAALDAQPVPEIYISYLQNPPVAPFLAIRTQGDPAAIAEPVRYALRALDSSLSVYDMRTMSDVRAASVAGRRFVVMLGVLFGVVALMLAAVGVYGVMTLAVEERTQEVGIRLALGARRSEVVALILKGTARIGLAGLAVGLVVFTVLSPAIRGQLYGVGRLDPATVTLVPALLMLVAVVATIVPVMRALRVNPVIALRHE
jgi:predicted permease